MPSNSFTLEIGTYMIYCAAAASRTSTTVITQLGVGLFSANGDNTTTIPATLESVANLTVDAVSMGESKGTAPSDLYSNYIDLYTFKNLEGFSFLGPIVRVTIAGGTSGSIYIVPFVTADATACNVWVRWYIHKLI
jgi:hypothetical protein